MNVEMKIPPPMCDAVSPWYQNGHRIALISVHIRSVRIFTGRDIIKFNIALTSGSLYFTLLYK